LKFQRRSERLVVVAVVGLIAQERLSDDDVGAKALPELNKWAIKSTKQVVTVSDFLGEEVMVAALSRYEIRIRGQVSEFDEEPETMW
jgi:Flp pilus assembly protein CpaB